jgi:hypothetical protein
MPFGVTVRGEQIIVADTGTHCIREITAEYGVRTIAGKHSVRTYAGNYASGNRFGLGNEAKFNSPNGVAVMPHDQSIIVLDSGNERICKIDVEYQGPPAKKK